MYHFYSLPPEVKREDSKLWENQNRQSPRDDIRWAPPSEIILYGAFDLENQRTLIKVGFTNDVANL